MSIPTPKAFYDNLTDGARRHLVQALDNGDRWGYRCPDIFARDSIILQHNKRLWKWGDLAQCGFLSVVGADVARYARDGAQKARPSRDL